MNYDISQQVSKFYAFCIHLVCLLHREAVLWMSVKHQNKKAVEIWAKEIAAAGTGGEK